MGGEMMKKDVGITSRYPPFTLSQWQELRHQALIFDYMASGIPIPYDLILPIRRSFLLASTTTNPYGWGNFQMSLGRKAEDPEPGRCRRTDGKKWRCSREACPDSKYCVRHIHRGKNRSRKPVEIPKATSSCRPSPPHVYHTFHPCHLAPRPPGIHPPLLSSDVGVRSPRRACRYGHGLENVGSEASGGERESKWRFGTEKSSALKQSTCPHYETEHSNEEEEEQGHCFIDFKLEKPGRVEDDGQKTLHSFLGEWPLKSNSSWVELEEDYAKTQLSISIPMAR